MKIKLILSICLILTLFSGCLVDMDLEVASVNNEKIYTSEYSLILENVKSQMEQEDNVDWNSSIEGKPAIDVLKEKALDEAVKLKVQVLKAKETGITLPAETKSQIDSSIKQEARQLGGDENFKKQYGVSVKTYIKLLEEYYTSSELYKNTILSEVQISEDELLSKYELKKDEEYRETVKAKHILIKTVDDQNQELPDQPALKAKIDDIEARIKAGEDFDTLMNEYSEDEGLQTNPDGYTFGKGQMVSEFEQAAFSMKPGEVSEIVKTTYGYHILKFVEVVSYMSFEQAKDAMLEEKLDEQIASSLTERYERDKNEKYRQIEVSELMIPNTDSEGNPLSEEESNEKLKQAETYLERIKAGESFETIAKEINPESDGSQIKTLLDKSIQPVLFEEADKLAKGEISNVIEEFDGYYIFRVENPEAFKSFEQVKEEIKSDILDERYTEIIDDWKKGLTISKNDKVINNIKVE